MSEFCIHLTEVDNVNPVRDGAFEQRLPDIAQETVR